MRSRERAPHVTNKGRVRWARGLVSLPLESGLAMRGCGNADADASRFGHEASAVRSWAFSMERNQEQPKMVLLVSKTLWRALSAYLVVCLSTVFVVDILIREFVSFDAGRI